MKPVAIECELTSLNELQIMLRNIPNKIDQVRNNLSTKNCKHISNLYQGMLKSIIDETSYGKYDFMYLRIGKKSRKK